MVHHLKSKQLVEAAPAYFDQKGEECGRRMAKRNAAPRRPSPSTEESEYIGAANQGLLDLNGARREDEQAFGRRIRVGRTAQDDRDAGRTTTPPDSFPWPGKTMVTLAGLLIVVLLGIDAIVLERPWRDLIGLPDQGDELRRYLPPTVFAGLLALFAYMSAHGADLVAGARTARARSRGWVLALAGGALMLGPVLAAAAIRTAGEANRVQATGGVVSPQAGASFLAVQLMLGAATLGLSHLRHFLLRRRTRVRGESYQRQTIADGNEASQQLTEFQEGEQDQRDRFGWAIAQGAITLRKTVANEMDDPIGAAEWEHRNTEDLRALGQLGDGTPPPLPFGPAPRPVLGDGGDARPDEVPANDPPADAPRAHAGPEPEPADGAQIIDADATPGAVDTAEDDPRAPARNDEPVIDLTDDAGDAAHVEAEADADDLWASLIDPQDTSD